MSNLSRTVASLRDIKLAGNDTDMTFSGYGAVFNNIDSYGDLIVPGAFADTLAAARKSGEWPVMLMQHGGMGLMAEDMMPIGIWTDMSEDGIGLKLTGKLADTVRGREAYTLMKMQPRPAITGLSIGYIAKEYSPRSKPEEPRRTLKKVDLFEVSLVTFPANPKARVSDVKSSHGLTVRDAEEALRDAGFSRTESKAILAKGYSALGQREAGETGYADELRNLIATISR
jgi:HK97 family phage prohead protease